MKILAIEFSSSQRSVAVVDAPDPRLPSLALAEVIANDPPRTAGRRSPVTGQLLPAAVPALTLVEAALREARLEREQIEGLAVGLGPGSYNGIRAAIALAQGWQLAREVKLLGISSAEGLAAQAHAEGLRGRVTVLIDAQRNEFYLAGYELSDQGRREIEPLRLATLAEAQARQTAGDLLLGPEVTKWFPNGHPLFPRAATLGQIAQHRGDFVPGEQLEPIYLRETTFVKAPPPRKLTD
jgi:tRNA threonylcarbamoyladenosine biosynthesis protein TsaB